MSLAQRQKSRFEHRSFSHQQSGTSVTVMLIVVNALIFVLQVFALNDMQNRAITANFALKPAFLMGYYNVSEIGGFVPSIFTLLTYQFLHGGWTHVIFNMFTLFFFGRQIEMLLGRERFLLFYLLGGIGAGLAHSLTQAQSYIPTVGASGAISAVTAATLMFYPRQRLTVFIYFIPLSGPAYLFLGGWFVWQVFAGFTGASGGIAWWAHVGGFVVGIALLPLFKSKTLRYDRWFQAFDYLAQPSGQRGSRPAPSKRGQRKKPQEQEGPAQIIALDEQREKAYRMDLRALRDGFMSKEDFQAKWGDKAEQSQQNQAQQAQDRQGTETAVRRRSRFPSSDQE